VLTKARDESNETLPNEVGQLCRYLSDGQARIVADQMAFPNGMVITPDDRTLIVGFAFLASLMSVLSSLLEAIF